MAGFSIWQGQVSFSGKSRESSEQGVHKAEREPGKRKRVYNLSGRGKLPRENARLPQKKS
jgi:hypothetical protein